MCDSMSGGWLFNIAIYSLSLHCCVAAPFKQWYEKHYDTKIGIKENRKVRREANVFAQPKGSGRVYVAFSHEVFGRFPCA